MLPAMLRIQSFRGRRKTRRLPAAVAMIAAKLIANPVRAMAIHCQSTCSLSATVNIAITANDAAPNSMHRYGSTAERNIGLAGGRMGESSSVRETACRMKADDTRHRGMVHGSMRPERHRGRSLH